MRRVLFALALAYFSLPLFAQEVVVFKDFRSLVVSSHREAGAWTYLKIDGGEIAVSKSQIAEFRNETADSRGGGRPEAPGFPASRPASLPEATVSKPVQNPEITPDSESPEDEEEDPGAEEEDEGEEEEEAQPPPQLPPRMRTATPAPRPPTGATAQVPNKVAGGGPGK